MRNIPHGYTWTEVIVAGLAMLFIGFLVILAINPREEMAKANDEDRREDIEDILQMMIELGQEDSEAFAASVAQAANGRVMFGLDQSCRGWHGSQCTDEVLADTCLATSIFANAGEIFPVDPLEERFDVTKTGYYLDFQEGRLLIGACYPQTQEKIELELSL